jgi:hypothetical protein
LFRYGQDRQKSWQAGRVVAGCVPQPYGAAFSRLYQPNDKNHPFWVVFLLCRFAPDCRFASLRGTKQSMGACNVENTEQITAKTPNKLPPKHRTKRVENAE